MWICWWISAIPRCMVFLPFFFGFKEKLERIFGKPVDLITSDSLANPYFRKSVEASKQLVYEA